MAGCKYCPNPTEQGALCQWCRRKLGLVDDGGPVRRSLPCQRCNHPELVRALAREMSSSPGEHGDRELFPMVVTLVPKAKFGFFSGEPKGVGEGQFQELLGVLEMYVCRKCGFTEWYCRDPESIPIGDEYGTEVVITEGETPYR